MAKNIEQPNVEIPEENAAVSNRYRKAYPGIIFAGVTGLAVPYFLSGIVLLIRYSFFDYHQMDLEHDLEQFPGINFAASFACCLIFSLAAVVNTQTAKRNGTSFTQALIMLGLSAIASFFLANIIVYGTLIVEHRKAIDPLGPTHAIILLALLIAIPSAVTYWKIYWSHR